MEYSISIHNNIAELSKKVDTFLNNHPVLNFEAISILEKLRENPHAIDGTLECIIVSESEQIQVVSCRIRPYNLLISHSTNIKSIYPLVEHFRQEGIFFPGIYGSAEEVKQFTHIWKELSGEDFTTSDKFLQYSMTTQKKPAKHLGKISLAKAEHKELLKGWTKRSIREIIPESTEEFVNSCTDSFLKLLEQNKAFILEVDNIPVSMAAISGQTKKMQAIIDVYTPLKCRGKGYATELCIFLCDYILNDCKKTPILWVKASNYAAIHIYEKIGFDKVAEMALYLKEN